MRRLVIGAPFGNYLHFPCTTATLGTFTAARRGGIWYRLWRCLRTLRYSQRLGGWINKLGLPNPGIDVLRTRVTPLDDRIVSIHGFTRADWWYLLGTVALSGGRTVELNLSCPNVPHRHTIDHVQEALNWGLKTAGLRVIAKLPPRDWFDLAEPLYAQGVRCFHLCNTLPTPRGGLSGKTLKPYSLRAVEVFRKRWGDTVDLIGGGGVTGVADVKDYLAAGADRVAVASFLLNPFNWRKIPQLVKALERVLPTSPGCSPQR